MNMVNIKNNIVLISGVIFYSLFSLLIIFYNHHFYDDEIFNLSKMSLSFRELFLFIQAGDVHPPLSYFINKTIFSMFASYKAILIFSIIINAGALAYFYNYAEKQLVEKYSKIILFIFTFSNGGLLLWTNSVRWYAYWVPLFIILYTYLLKHQRLTHSNIIIVAVLLSVMTYTNYLTFLLLAAISVYFILLRRNDLNIKNTLLFCFVYFSLSIYQIYVFFTIHLHNKGSQVSDILNSSLNAVYGVLNGGSIFIADPIFLTFSVFTLVIIVIGFKNMFIEKTNSSLFTQSITLLAILLLLMILTGVSGKYRNNIALSIPFFFILSYLFTYIKYINIKRIYILFTIILSIVSISNLVTHTNTSKNSYNMPISELNNLLEYPQGKLIVVYDPATYFEFLNKGYKILNISNHYNNLDVINISKGTDVYLIQTYQGSLSNKKYKSILSLYGMIIKNIDTYKTEKIGIDRYAGIKNKLPGGRPKIDEVQMYVFHGKLKNSLLVQPLHREIENE